MSAPLRRKARAICVGAAALALASCVFDSEAPRARPRAAIIDVSASANATNVLSARVSFHSRNADSARVFYCASGASIAAGASACDSTPFYAVAGDSTSITALGLAEQTSYNLRLDVSGGGSNAAATVTFTTEALPPALAGLQLRGIGAPSAGFTITDYTLPGLAYIVVFNDKGLLAWYRGFPAEDGASGIDAEQRANGNFTLFVGASTGWQPTNGKFYVVSSSGESLSAFAAAAPYFTDPHELVFDYSGGQVAHAHLFGYDVRHVDLSSIGGRTDQMLSGHVLLRQSPTGAVEFSWSAWDHFDIKDWVFVPAGLAKLESIDFDHPNSIDRDSHGDYIISFASLGEITKINATTGAIIWRFGGKHNQFTFVGDELGGFGIQHDVRLLSNGNILLMDNGLLHVPTESRAVEYRIDESAHTATMVWEFRLPARIFSPFAGSVQRMRDGNTIVAFGAAAHVCEITPGGDIIWEADLVNNSQRAPFLYRARRISSLYESIPR